MPSVIEISPLTRVEGHGKVKVHLEGSRVERVELSLTESPRLFEALLIGKSFAEVPDIVCRICSLCSTIHKVTALEAVEKALRIEVGELTRLTRELIVCGGTLQDHALHLYCLVLPDLFQLRGVSELAAREPELLKQGLAVKRVGNLIQEAVGGRLIHPVNIRVGGLGRRIDPETLLRLKDELLAILPLCRRTVALFVPAFPFPPLPAPNYLALEMPLNTYSGDLIGMADGRFFHVDSYRDYTRESVKESSHAKYAKVLEQEPTVGALSRLNLAPALGPESAALLETVRGEVVGNDIRGNNAAQAVELCHAAERALAVIDRLLQAGPGSIEARVKPGRGRGSAASEAPRGLLIHSYSFDDSGLCTEADVITPTTLNQGAMARDLLALARAMEGSDPASMKYSLERLVRCYDPCISCSVHVITR